MSLLQLESVSKQLGSRWALQAVDLSVSAGTIGVLLGPNGAGKTTLMRLACGRIAPDAGSVRVAGLDPAIDARARARLGFVPQNVGLYPALTVRENLTVLGGLMGVDRRSLRDRVAVALAQVGLGDRVDAVVSTLSGGMQRRLNIVASTLHQPDLLLLDEPTVGIDVDAREQVHDLLLHLRAAGQGILLTTHDLQQAERLADSVTVLDAGRVSLCGAPTELIDAVFAGGRELVVQLAPAANVAGDTRTQALLADLGLAPRGAGDLTYGLIVPRKENHFARAATLGDALTKAGIVTTQVGVVAAGLEGVILRIQEEQPDA